MTNEIYAIYFFHQFIKYIDKLSTKYDIFSYDLTITELENLINQLEGRVYENEDDLIYTKEQRQLRKLIHKKQWIIERGF